MNTWKKLILSYDKLVHYLLTFWYWILRPVLYLFPCSTTSYTHLVNYLAYLLAWRYNSKFFFQLLSLTLCCPICQYPLSLECLWGRSWMLLHIGFVCIYPFVEGLALWELHLCWGVSLIPRAMDFMQFVAYIYIATFPGFTPIANIHFSDVFICSS